MLVVRGKKETNPSPPVYGVQGMGTPNQKVVEGHREGSGVETSQTPSVRWLWREKSTGAVLDFLGSTRVGCIRARRVVPEEATRAGSGDEGEEGGPGPPAV